MHTKKPVQYLGIIGILLAVATAAALFAYSSLSAKAAQPGSEFTKYNISARGGFAIGITVDQNGNPWFGLGNASIGTIDQKSGNLKSYPLANTNAGVGTIKVAPNGDVWFTEGNAPGIGKINPTTGQETDYQLPPSSRSLTPTFIVLDGNGNAWFNEADYSDATGGKLGRLGPDGKITEWSVPTVGAELEEIALDSKGNLWFAEQGNSSFNPVANKVGKLDPVNGTITEYTSPTPNSRPAGIVVASDDTVWFSEHATDKIAHLFPDQAKGVTTPVTPTSTASGPTSSTQTSTPNTPTNPVNSAAQEVDATSQVTTSPGIIEYSLPHTGSVSNTEDMRFDKKGNLYYEDDATHQIGALIFGKKGDAPTIQQWAIPGGIGFFNIEFDSKGKTLWISDTANFGSGGSVYSFNVN